MSRWLPLSPNLSPTDERLPPVVSPSQSPSSSTSAAPPAPAQPAADTYVLGRDFKSASRLNYEHYLWQETLGYNLHPSIITSLAACSTATVRIADVACGTGIWLRQVAQALPAAHVDGFDASLAQCPPVHWLPSNTRLREWNLFDAPPTDCLARYDVVHVRLILVVVRDDDPVPVIRNLMRLLKPGGVLQWDELNVCESYILRAGDRGAAEPAAAPVMEGMTRFLAGLGHWVRGLSRAMNACGMVDTQMWDVAEREDLARAFFDNHLSKDEEMAGWRFGGRETAEGRDLLERVRGMWVESQAGTVLVTPKVVATGRKPLGPK